MAEVASTEGAPLLLIPVQSSLLEGDQAPLVELAHHLQSGSLEGVTVDFADLETLASRARWLHLPDRSHKHTRPDRTTKAAELLQASTDLSDLTAAQEQELDDIPLEELRQRLWSSRSLREQAEVLELLTRRLGQ